MDYVEYVEKVFYDSWEEYLEHGPQGRLILLDTKGKTSYGDFSFAPSDRLIVGRESDGVPEDVYGATDHQITIPMHPPMRSLNMAISAAMVLGEALRQNNMFYGNKGL